MLLKNVALFSTLSALVAADISPSDIPQQCTSTCAEILSIARRCDDTTNNDAAELSCICTAPNANTLLSACDACVTQYDLPDDDDRRDDDNNDRNDPSDVREVLTRCAFSTNTPASALPTPTPMGTRPSGPSGAPPPPVSTVQTTVQGGAGAGAGAGGPQPIGGAASARGLSGVMGVWGLGVGAGIAVVMGMMM